MPKISKYDIFDPEFNVLDFPKNKVYFEFVLENNSFSKILFILLFL